MGAGSVLKAEVPNPKVANRPYPYRIKRQELLVKRQLSGSLKSLTYVGRPCRLATDGYVLPLGSPSIGFRRPVFLVVHLAWPGYRVGPAQHALLDGRQDSWTDYEPMFRTLLL